MADTLNKTYTVNKGETIEKIARKFEHRDWRTIWKAPENKELVSKRRDPDKIQPGDKLVIPPNEKQIKVNSDKLKSLNETRDVNVKLRDAFAADAARREKSVKVHEDLIKGTVQTKNEILDGLEKDLRSMQNTGLAVDTLKELILAIPGAVGKAAKLGKQVASASMEELKKIAKDTAKEEIKDKIKDKATEAAADALKDRKDDDNEAIALAGTLLDSWDKIQSPSFWANTVVQLKEGKSWSEATTRDIGDDIRERMVQVEKSYNPHIHKLYEARNAAKARAEQSRKMMRECEARAKDAEKEASGLPAM